VTRGAVIKRETSTRGAELVNAAARLFYERGYPETTTREITDACGVTPGALYNHFISKEDLLWVIVREAYREIERRLLAAVERGDGDPVAELRELVLALTEMYTTTFKMKAVVARAERGRLPAERTEQIEEMHESAPRIVAATLQRGIDRGAFDFPEVDGEPADLLVLGRSICGFCIFSGDWFEPREPVSSGQLARLYTKLVLKMAGADPLTAD
jgi:AcrR family transcriptional regulator